MDRRQPTTESEIKKSFMERGRNRLVAAGLTAVMGVTALAGCSQDANAEGPKPTVTQSTEATSSPTPSATETEPADQKTAVEMKFELAQEEYDRYLSLFNPEQKAAYDRLQPDNLAEMTDAQMVEAFAIPQEEVMGENGEIDPEKYAISVSIRTEASNRGLCSRAVFDRFGGAINMTSADMEVENARYTRNAAHALTSTGDGDSSIGVTQRCDMIESIRELSEEGENAIGSYVYLQSLVPNSVNYDAESGFITFSTHAVDNYDSEAIKEYVSDSNVDQLDELITHTLYNLHIDDAGNAIVSPY